MAQDISTVMTTDPITRLIGIVALGDLAVQRDRGSVLDQREPAERVSRKTLTAAPETRWSASVRT